MPQKKHQVHEVDDDVLQGVWLRKNTYRGVKVKNKGVPGVQGPPSPSKRPSSPVKPTSEEARAPPGDSFDHDDLFTARESAFTWGKVCSSRSMVFWANKNLLGKYQDTKRLSQGL